jgi:tetratricopeptide (TPR) repeat protein
VTTDTGDRVRVFLSYSHDSAAHKERVLSLSERLRKDGIETRLDQYVPGTPRETWPRWMLDQLDWGEFVLVVCTQTYYRRFRGHEVPGKGKGADWEGAVITQAIYDARSATTKFVPVLFDPKDELFIPEPLRGRTFYLATSEEGYQALYDFLLDQAGVEPGALGPLKRKPRKRGTPLSFEPEEAESTPLANETDAHVLHARVTPVVTIPFDRLPRAQAGVLFGRDAQLDDLVQRLRRRENTCVWGPAGFGKTALAAEALLHVVGDTEETLAQSPFPDGVVVIDLYRLKANEDQAWHLLADKFDPAIPAELPARERAERACKGRRGLVAVEGAEEAHDGQTLRNLLDVLDEAARQLILTRSTAQAYHPHPIRLDAELEPGDAIALLEKLTENRIDADILSEIVKATGGHPLGLTWAGCQLALGEEPPTRFLAEMQQEHLPALHEPGYEDHTLKWLYDRSARMLTQDAKGVVCGAGLLAAAPFGTGAAMSSLDQGAEATGVETEQRAHEALKLLVRHGLLRIVPGEDELWEFSHALAARFARGEAEVACPPLAPLYAWALAALRQGVERVRQTNEFSALGNALLHATALLAHDDSGDAGWPLANWLLYEGQDRFFALGRLASARDSLTAGEAWMQRMPPARSAEPRWCREQAGLLSRQGDVQLAQGDLSGTRDSYQKSREMLEKLAAGDPTNAQWQRDLSVSLNKLGDVQLAQGDLAGARDSYQKSREIAEKLAAGDPTNAQWQRDLSISLERLGNVQLAQGDLDTARDFYQNSYQIREKLVRADPTNAKWQGGLSISLEKLGDVQLAQGDLGGARDSYQKDLEIAEKLAEDDPSNAEWQYDLGISNEKLGDVLWTQGDLKGALDAYRKKQEIITRLAAGDPTNAQWQRDLMVSHTKLGKVASRAGDKPAAQREFSAGLAIMERLCRLDPTNGTWRKDVEWLRQQLQS